MRTLKKPSSRLKMKAIRNLSLGIACLAASVPVFLTIPTMPFHVAVGEYSTPLALILPLLLILAFFFFFPRYFSYKRGADGENEVMRALSALSNEYGMLSNVTLRRGFGDIDHIVLGPNGIFVIETKNWRGEITFVGDECQSKYSKRDRGSSRLSVSLERRSPSMQAKAGAARVREVVESLGTFGSHRICVEALVVFTGTKAVLDVKEKPRYARILRTPELVGFIKSAKPEIQYSTGDIDVIGKKLLESQG